MTLNTPMNIDAGVHSRLRPALPGLLLAVATLLFGFGLGIVFGYNEDPSNPGSQRRPPP
ncbi:hypothetical protein BH24GEM1_BH24GEM1_06900 [soil metagenome]